MSGDLTGLCLYITGPVCKFVNKLFFRHFRNTERPSVGNSTSKKSSFRLSIVFEDPESTESEEDETDSFDQKSFDKSEFDQNKFNDTPDRALECILIEEEQVKLAMTRLGQRPF